MMLPTAPLLASAQEARRLLSLGYYDVAHSLSEPVFQTFACLATSLVRTPMARLSLVDAAQTHYLASAGQPGASCQPRLAGCYRIRAG